MLSLTSKKAIHNACKSIWSNIQTYGCRIHLLQSWYVQTVGLSVEYKTEDSRIENWIIKCFGLIFLATELVFDYFEVFLLSLLSARFNDTKSPFKKYLQTVRLKIGLLSHLVTGGENERKEWRG